MNSIHDRPVINKKLPRVELSLMGEGYVTYTGQVTTQSEANTYNGITAEIKRTTYPPLIETLKDKRHKYYVYLCQDRSTKAKREEFNYGH